MQREGAFPCNMKFNIL